MDFKQYFFSSVFLTENKKQAELLVQSGKLSSTDFNQILQIDPTSTKKYTGWMAKQWVLNQIRDIDTLRNTIEEFNSFLIKGKTKNKDIYQYKTFKDLRDEVTKLNQTGEGVSVKDLESDYDVVRDDEDLYIAVPHTHEASRKLGLSKFAFRDCEEGKDSSWCTTYKAPDHFNQYYYEHNVTFYYVLVKSDRLKQMLKQNNFEEKHFVVALAVLPEDLSKKASEKGYSNIDGYDGLDKQFSGKKLQKYLKILGLK